MRKSAISVLTSILLLLIFITGCTTTPSTGLTDATWDLVSYQGSGGNMVEILPGTIITAEFGEDGSVAGSAGCNNYFGTYEVTENSMTIGPTGSTLMYCEDDGLMEQETAYITNLNSVKYYSITGNQLTLEDENGNAILIYSVSAG